MTTTATRTPAVLPDPTITPKVNRATRVALLLAEVSSPAVLVTALLFLVAWRDAPDLRSGLCWGAISVLFVAVVPMAFVLHGVRRQHWSDHHIPERSKRMVPMLFGCTSVAVGYLLLNLVDAPESLVTINATIVVEALVLTAITRFWKISGHVAAAASCATVAAFVHGPAFILTWLAVPLVAWSRVQTRRACLAEGPVDDQDELDGHTPAQTVAGALVAAVTVSAAFLVAGIR